MARNENRKDGDHSLSASAGGKGKGKGKARQVDDESVAASGSSATALHHQPEQRQQQQDEDVKMAALPPTAIFSPSPPPQQPATATRLSAKAAGKRKASPEPDEPVQPSSSSAADAVDASRPRKREREDEANKPPALLGSYMCPICLSPPTNATTTPCGHLFCGDCLFRALKQQASNRSAQERFMPSMLQHHPRNFFSSSLAPSSGRGAQDSSQSFRAWWDNRRVQNAVSSAGPASRSSTASTIQSAPPPFSFAPVLPADDSTVASSTGGEVPLSRLTPSTPPVHHASSANVRRTEAAGAGSANVHPRPRPPRAPPSSAAATLSRRAASLSAHVERESRLISSLRTELVAAEASYDHAVRFGVPAPRNAGVLRPPSPPLPPPMPPTALLPSNREIERLMGEEEIARANFDSARARLADRRRMAEIYRSVIARHDITIDVVRRLEAAIVARNERCTTQRAESRAVLLDQLLHDSTSAPSAPSLPNLVANANSDVSSSRQPLGVPTAAGAASGRNTSARLHESLTRDLPVEAANAETASVGPTIDSVTEALMRLIDQAQEDSEALELIRSRRLRADSHRATLTRDHLEHQEAVQQAQAEFSQAQHRWFNVRESLYRQAEIHALDFSAPNQPGSSTVLEASSTDRTPHTSEEQEPDIMDIPLLRHTSSTSSLRRSGAIRLPMTSTNAAARQNGQSSQDAAIAGASVPSFNAAPSSPPFSDVSWTDSVHSLLAEDAQESTQEEWWGAMPTSTSDVHELAEAPIAWRRPVGDSAEAEAEAQPPASSAVDVFGAIASAAGESTETSSRARLGPPSSGSSTPRPPWTSTLVPGSLAVTSDAPDNFPHRPQNPNPTRDSAPNRSLEWGQGSTSRTSNVEPLGWRGSLTASRSSSHVPNLPLAPSASPSADLRQRYGAEVATALAAWEASASDAVHLLRMDLDAAAQAAYDGARRAAEQARALRRREVEHERRSLLRLQDAIEAERRRVAEHGQQQRSSSSREPQQQTDAAPRDRSAQAPSSSTSFGWRVIQPGSTGGALVLDSSASEWSAASSSVSPPSSSLRLPFDTRSTSPSFTRPLPSARSSDTAEAPNSSGALGSATTSAEHQDSQRRIVRSVVRDELRTLMTRHPLPAPLEYVVRQHPLVQRSMGIVNNSAPHPEQVNDAELRSANFGIVVRQMQRLTQLVGEDVRVARVLMEGVDDRNNDGNSNTPINPLHPVSAGSRLASSSSVPAGSSSNRREAPVNTLASSSVQSQSRILERIEMLVGQLRAALDEVDVSGVGALNSGTAADPAQAQSASIQRNVNMSRPGAQAASGRNRTSSSRYPLPVSEILSPSPSHFMEVARPGTHSRQDLQESSSQGPSFTRNPPVRESPFSVDRLPVIQRADTTARSNSTNDTRLPPIDTFVFGREQGRSRGEDRGTTTDTSGNGASEPFQFTFRLSPPINLPEGHVDDDQLTPAGRWSRIHELADRGRDSNMRSNGPTSSSSSSTGGHIPNPASEGHRSVSLLRSRGRRLGRVTGEVNRSDFNFVPILPDALSNSTAPSGTTATFSAANPSSATFTFDGARPSAASTAHAQPPTSERVPTGASFTRPLRPLPRRRPAAPVSAEPSNNVHDIAQSVRMQDESLGQFDAEGSRGSRTGRTSSSAPTQVTDTAMHMWRSHQDTRGNNQATHNSSSHSSGSDGRAGRTGRIPSLLDWFQAEPERERQRGRQRGVEGIWRLDADASTNQGLRRMNQNQTAAFGSLSGDGTNSSSTASATLVTHTSSSNADRASERAHAAEILTSARRATTAARIRASRVNGSPVSARRATAAAGAPSSADDQNTLFDTLSGGTCPLCRTLIGGFNVNMEPLPKELPQGASSSTGSTVTGGRSSLASSSRNRLVPPRGVRGLRLTMGAPADQTELCRREVKPEAQQTDIEQPATKRAKLEAGRVDIAREDPKVEGKGKSREDQSYSPTRPHEHQPGVQTVMTVPSAAQGTLEPGSTTISLNTIGLDPNNSLLRFQHATGRYFRMLPRRAFASLRGNQADPGRSGSTFVPGQGGASSQDVSTASPTSRTEAFTSRSEPPADDDPTQPQAPTLLRGADVTQTGEINFETQRSDIMNSSLIPSYQAGGDGSSLNAPIVVFDDDDDDHGDGNGDDDDDVVVVEGGSFPQSALNTLSGHDTITDHIRTPGFAPSGGRLRSPESAVAPDLAASSSGSSQQRDESASEAEGSSGGPARPLKRRRSPDDDGEEERLVDRAMRFHTFQL